MGSLDGRRVLVTGASAGIGEATARACAAAGARVACLARRTARIEAVASETGGIAVAADVTDHAAAQEAVHAAASGLGGLDALVNNAGVMWPARVGDGAYEDWRAMFEVNVLGLLSVTQAALGHLRDAGRADIVNVSSMSGRRVPPTVSAGVYSATKHAVHALSLGLRRELDGTRVRVTVVSPGIVATGIGLRGDPDDEEVVRQRSDIGLRPEDVARAIVNVLGEPPEVDVFEVALVASTQEL